jgi:acetoacetate decarboxylase
MTLEGWSLPLSPGGSAALVPPPPWHFSGEALGIDFHCDPEAAAAVLPEGLEPVGDGSASFVFCDWSSSADLDPRMMADPARGQYIQGFPKKLGTVSITKAVAVGSGGPKVEPGGRFTGHVSSLGVRLARGTVTLETSAEEGYIPKAMRLPVWHTRLVPDLAGGKPLVYDLARNIVSGFAVANVWTGTADLELFESEFEELAALRPLDIVGGFRCSVAFSIDGAEIRPA